MSQKRQNHHSPSYWLPNSPLAPYVDAFRHHLTEGGYPSRRVAAYLACIAHFARWPTPRHPDIRQINEALVKEFLDEHLPCCDCAWPVSRNRIGLRAALGHLLFVLRANAAIPEPDLGTTPVDIELRRFDDYMNHVRGLAPKTRSHYLRIVRDLLIQRFADQPVAIPAIKPDDARQFLASQGRLYKTPGSLGAPVSALRGYFRFRTCCGDQVHHLIGVVNYPANWQLASLPKALSREEVERLQEVLGDPASSSRRDDAIVRCALDLGLRSSEVAKLGLDDIDWRAGTITLRKTKSRREDVLPLPEATGQAIAGYLRLERPPTSNRSVFVRRIAPCDRPIGPDLVRKAIRQAYARAGLPYTRSHLLRHTMASRLLDGGSSLKEVADVLRRRSLNTTLAYAKPDSRNLAAVALPWPGSAS
jgi:integrase